MPSTPQEVFEYWSAYRAAEVEFMTAVDQYLTAVSADEDSLDISEVLHYWSKWKEVRNGPRP